MGNVRKKQRHFVGRLTEDEYRALCPRDKPSLKRLTESEYRKLWSGNQQREEREHEKLQR
jgi:hypothetical protein